jgi:phosphoadenosine phosphosulfate reductase
MTGSTMTEPIAVMQELNIALRGLPIHEGIALMANRFPGQTVFSTSFGIEDQVLTDIIARAGLPVRIFTLDTGRLFQETYTVWSATLQKYGIDIEAFAPDSAGLEAWLKAHGPNGFYESVENRKSCCHIRKVLPLQRALQGNRVWITGIRAAQSANRDTMPVIEWDDVNSIIKYHPLLHMTYEELRLHVSAYEVPINPLHDRGFVSIGCAPCTRAIREGEDFRAGRWWWEDNSKKECGLHAHQKA